MIYETETRQFNVVAVTVVGDLCVSVCACLLPIRVLPRQMFFVSATRIKPPKNGTEIKELEIWGFFIII